jgi:hypothetical protein
MAIRKGSPEIEKEADQQNAASAEQIRGASAEEHEAARCNRVRTDDRLQRLRRVSEIAADIRQRDHDDVLIERDDQHRKREECQHRRRMNASDVAGEARSPVTGVTPWVRDRQSASFVFTE